MGPHTETAGQAEEREDHYLAVARVAFPEWDIVPTFPGYEARPKGTQVVQAADLDTLVRKLREQG